MTFVCDPLSIILIAGLTFVFVLLAILLAYAIIVLSGIARVMRKLRAVSDEVESLLLTPLELLESLIGQLKQYIEGWKRKEGKPKKGEGRKRSKKRVKVEEETGGEFEIKELK